MDFNSYIKFDHELIENEYCKITYSGYLFENNSDLVNIVYGFDENWVHTTEQKMEKTESGFVVNVKIQNFNTFNFCFKNSKNEWDNNYQKNYSIPISSESVEENFILNENILDKVLDNLFEYDLSNGTNETVKDLTKENNTSIENTPFEINVEDVAPINIEESLVNKEEEISLDKDIENLFNEIYEEANTYTSDKQDLLDNILLSKSDSTDQTINSIGTDFNIDSLIDEILSPIVESSVFDEENSENIKETFETSQPVQEITVNDDVDNTREENIVKSEDVDTLINELNSLGSFENDKSSETLGEISLIDLFNDENKSDDNTSLVEVKSDNKFSVSPRTLSKFYMFKKKVKLAFYKLFVSLPKFLSGSLGQSENK